MYQQCVVFFYHLEVLSPSSITTWYISYNFLNFVTCAFQLTRIPGNSFFLSISSAWGASFSTKNLRTVCLSCGKDVKQLLSKNHTCNDCAGRMKIIKWRLEKAFHLPGDGGKCVVWFTGGRVVCPIILKCFNCIACIFDFIKGLGSETTPSIQSDPVYEPHPPPALLAASGPVSFTLRKNMPGLQSPLIWFNIDCKQSVTPLLPFITTTYFVKSYVEI